MSCLFYISDTIVFCHVFINGILIGIICVFTNNTNVFCYYCCNCYAHAILQVICT